MSTTNADLGLRLSGREVFTPTEAPSAASEAARTLATGSHSLSKTLGPTTVPVVDSPIVSREITIPGGGSVTLDLTAIAGLALPAGATRTLDLTGKKVKAILFRAKKTNNAAGVNIAPGAANPYPIFGAGNDFTLYPDAQIVHAFRETEPPAGVPAVAAGAKTIDLTGTLNDVVWIDAFFGA